MNHILVIAEAGVNHNGDFNLAIQLVEAAKIGADAVKFQTLKHKSSPLDKPIKLLSERNYWR